MKKMTWFSGALALAVLTTASLASAADHRDSPATIADPAADINDVYGWVEGGKMILAMTVFPVADMNLKFSDKIQYVLHTESAAGFGMAGTKTNIIATFDATQKIQLWVGDKGYVTGDASATAGLTSEDGKIKVFAGLRSDPFFFNLEGFLDAVSTVTTVAAMNPPVLMFDPSGCPNVDAATSAVLVDMLQSTQMGAGPAVDFFGMLNTLAIVIEVDKALLTGGGNFVNVWASTNMAGG